MKTGRTNRLKFSRLERRFFPDGLSVETNKSTTVRQKCTSDGQMPDDLSFQTICSSSSVKTTVAHNCHGKIFLLTAKSISPRQNHFRHGKINITHGKINFATAKSFYSRQNQFRHGKIISTHALTVKSFWLTCSRDISSQSAMGVNPTWRSSSWFLGSTCIAQTVENIVLATTHFCVQCRQGKP